MPYSLLADATMLLHFLFIAFALLGGLLTIHWPRIMWLHLPAAAWAIGIELIGGYCPLTPLENWFRLKADEEGYTGGFIQHYLGSLIYPEGITPTISILLGLFVLLLNLSIYLWVFKTRRNP